MNRLSLEILQGESTLSWLNAQSNIDSWMLLCQSCPWNVPFLSPGFFKTWIKHYAPKWNPVLVLAKDADGRLAGVMPLGQCNELITGAGAQQAEYHGWLSKPEESGAFLAAALQALKETFPSCHLRLRYLPPLLPSQSVVDVCNQFPQVVTSLHSRPLLKLDEASLEKTLRKKSNRSKINRLRRIGEFGFRRLSDLEQVNDCIDRIIELYDFRQGAVNDSTPFSDDPVKKAFLLDWIRSSPEELHLSCTTLNGEIIGAYIGVNSEIDSHLAILAYSPEFAAFSPGKLQIYKTGQMLCADSISRLDLTPGGDPWKERFATHHDTVLELNAYSRMAEVRRLKVLEIVDNTVRKLLDKLHISPNRIKSVVHRIKQLKHAGLLDNLRALYPVRREYSVYRIDLDNYVHESGDAVIKTNALNHLLMYQQRQGGVSKKGFLSNALSNLESGGRSYTLASQANKLVCCIWLAQGQEHSFIEEVDQSVCYPTRGAVIHGDFTDQSLNNRQCFKPTAQRILSDLKQSGDTKRAYINISSSDERLKQLVKELGFKPICRVYFTRFLWHRRHWQEFQSERICE